MQYSCLLLFCGAMALAAEVHQPACYKVANIYKNLAQVKHVLGDRRRHTFTAEQSGMLYPELITLDGCDEYNCRLEISSSEGVRSNSDVYIKDIRSGHCSCGGGRNTSRPALLLNPERNLVQYKDNKAYAYVDSSVIEFADRPGKGTVEVNVEAADKNVSICFFTKQISWKVEHEISMPDETQHGRFVSHAVLRNDGSEPYCVENATFLTTHLEVGGSSGGELAYARFGLAGASRSLSNNILMGESLHELNVEELMGVRKYTHTGRLTIPAKGIVKQELIKHTDWTVYQLCKRTRILYDGHHRGKLQRNLRLNQTTFVPAGQLSIKDKGWVVYRTNIPHIAANERHDIDLGVDPDVSVEETVSTTTSNYSDSLNRTKNMVIELENYRSQEVEVDYELMIPEGTITDASHDGQGDLHGFRHDEKRVFFHLHVEGNGKIEFKIMVNFKVLRRKDLY